MPKDLIHYGGWEHRDVHNINGMAYVSGLVSISSLLHNHVLFLIGKSNFQCGRCAYGPSATAVCPDPVVLCGHSALRCHVDWGQHGYLGPHGCRDQDGACEWDCRNDLCGV